MKILIKTILILFFSIQIKAQSGFCKGWDNGYKQGYCFQKNGCFAPLPPLCPLPNFSNNTYTDGYNLGFTKGKEDNSKTINQTVKQYQPIEHQNYGEIVNNHIKQRASKYQSTYSEQNYSEQFDYFYELRNKSIQYFKEKDYFNCVIFYKKIVDFGFYYDSNVEVVAGVSYFKLWEQYKEKRYKKECLKALKKAIKHKNPKARKYYIDAKKSFRKK